MVTMLDCIRRVPALLDAIRISRVQTMEQLLSIYPVGSFSEI